MNITNRDVTWRLLLRGSYCYIDTVIMWRILLHGSSCYIEVVVTWRREGCCYIEAFQLCRAGQLMMKTRVKMRKKRKPK